MRLDEMKAGNIRLRNPNAKIRLNMSLERAMITTVIIKFFHNILPNHFMSIIIF
jgi:hypothetical protein